MQREQMVRFVMFVLRTHEPSRVWGGIRGEAEEIVDQWIQTQEAA